MQIKFLVIDDADKSRVALWQMLERFGFEVVKARNGAAAIDMYVDNRSFDVVVIDLDMPGMDAFRTARLIRKYQLAKRPYIIGTAAAPVHGKQSENSELDLFVVKSLVVPAVAALKSVPFSVIKGGGA